MVGFIDKQVSSNLFLRLLLISNSQFWYDANGDTTSIKAKLDDGFVPEERELRIFSDVRRVDRLFGNKNLLPLL